MTAEKSVTGQGLAASVAAYTAWGLLPVYWRLLAFAPPFTILCHRIVWSMLFVFILLVIQGRLTETARVFRQRSTMLLLAASSVLIAGNWLIYIWAVNSGRVLETSLGYYINPLVSMLFGFVFFHDHVRRLQWGAIGLACAGVAYQVFLYGSVPWVSLGLAFTFATYGLIRKTARVEALPGLFIETLILTVPAAWYLIASSLDGAPVPGGFTVYRTVLLMATGVITSLPLVWFAFGARRLRLVTVGILQYIAPTLTFFLGIFFFNEALSFPRMATFTCIWIALALYSIEGLRYSRLQGRNGR